MSDFFDSCLTRFISYAIAKEREHINDASNFCEGLYGSYCCSASINQISSPIRPIYDDFKDKMNKVINGEASCVIYDTPWWMNPRKRKWGYSDKELNPLGDVILYDEKGRYYPVFHTFVVSEFKNGGYKIKKLTGKDKMSACADLLKNAQEKLKGCSSSGYGSVKTSGGETHEYSVKSGTKIVSSPTGTYTATREYNFGSTPTYSVRANYRESRVDTYETVTKTTPIKKHLNQFYWLAPKDEIEEKSFSIVLQNQLKIMAFVEEYSTLGLFNQKRKKEILEAFDNMMNYSKLIVAKAILDRIGSDFYQKDEKLVDKAIDAEQQRLEHHQSSLKNVALTAFKKRKEIQNQIGLCKASLKELNRIKELIPQRVNQLKEVFEETEKRLSVLSI